MIDGMWFLTVWPLIPSERAISLCIIHSAIGHRLQNLQSAWRERDLPLDGWERCPLRRWPWGDDTLDTFC